MAENAMNETVEDRIASYLEAEEAPVAEQKQEEAPAEEEAPEVVAEADDGQETATEATEAATEEVEEVQIGTWQELADHLETDVAELYNLTIPVTGADGQKQEVALGEYKDSYQASEKIKAEQAEMVQAKQAFEQEAQERKQAVEERFFQASKMIEAVESQLVGGLDNTQMENLRMSDPAEYAAIRQDYTERLSGVNAMKQQFAQEYYQYQQGIEQQAEAERQKWFAQDSQRVTEIIPEWANQEVRQKESAELDKYLISNGYPEEVVKSGLSSSDKSIARKAMLYDRQQQAKPELKKKVVSIGKKVLKSGKSKSKADLGRDQISADYKKFQKSGGNDVDAAKYVEKYILGDF